MSAGSLKMWEGGGEGGFRVPLKRSRVPLQGSLRVPLVFRVQEGSIRGFRVLALGPQCEEGLMIGFGF